MQCPVDGSTLTMSERSGIEIDYCPQCRGVWLDRGELDKIIERSASMPPPAPPREDDGAALAVEMDRLESQVRAWSPAAQAMRAVWGVVQAREFVEGQDESEPEFDYLGHSQCRVDAFRRELVALGVPGVGAP